MPLLTASPSPPSGLAICTPLSVLRFGKRKGLQASLVQDAPSWQRFILELLLKTKRREKKKKKGLVLLKTNVVVEQINNGKLFSVHSRSRVTNLVWSPGGSGIEDGLRDILPQENYEKAVVAFSLNFTKLLLLQRGLGINFPILVLNVRELT